MEIKYTSVSHAIFAVVLILLAIGALAPYLIERYIFYNSSNIVFVLTKFLNQNESSFFLCVTLGLSLSILLVMVGLIRKINKTKTYDAIVYGLLGLFLSLFAFGSLTLTFFGLNLH